ncbi:MAG: hypothetical protein F6K11_37360 [Leptolyngbya sp. SIO3F4]|nr:hypothetical protein [Leptolyngbya sp. SIO3F4]
MASNKPSGSSSYGSSQHNNPEFWQQLDKDFPFKGVDEEKLRQQTEQWVTCASELLGMPPSSIKKKMKC